MAISKALGWKVKAATITLLLVIASPSPRCLSAQGAGGSTGGITPPTPDQLAEMDQFIRGDMERYNIPGVVIGVASRGELVFWKGYGMANVELRVPAADSTVWEIGSISKEFVSAAVMLLVEEGRLGLDDPIHRHLAELPSEWLGVTVRQLLTHTSGIPDYEEIQTYEAYRFRFTPPLHS